MATFNIDAAKQYINEQWTQSIIPALEDYIRIPNQSPNYTYDDATALQAAHRLVDWVNSYKISSITAEVKQSNKSATEKRTPIILVVVEPTKVHYQDVLLYGHFDKQPPMDPWTSPYQPYVPVYEESTGKLYGRGAADDGYAIFACVTSILALKQQNVPHDRYVILIEGDEESGRGDVEAYIEEFKGIIGNPSLIICTDSGGGDWTHLWLTTSLRGVVNATVDVKVLEEPAHSGVASGIIASSFHVQRTLIDRLETDQNGVVNNNAFTVTITDDIVKQANDLAPILGDTVYNQFKMAQPNGTAIDTDIANLIINNTFKPTLCITGVSGIPDVATAGNVVRTNTTFTYSIRLPPGKDANKVSADLKKILTKDPPFGATVTYAEVATGNGWLSPPISELGWLGSAITEASKNFFDSDKVLTQGQGGSIPLISHLSDLYPSAKFIVTGVLGPGANAHAINEFLDTIYAKKITGSLAYVFYSLATQK